MHGEAVKKPIPVDWYLWDGKWETELDIRDWATPVDTEIWFSILTPEQARRTYNDETFTAEVYDYLHVRWIPLKTGWYVMKGVDGECYPCAASVFARSYNVTLTHYEETR